MNLTLPRLFRHQKRNGAYVAATPISQAQKPLTYSAVTSIVTHPAWSIDELRYELRAALERLGQGYFEFGEILSDAAVDGCSVFANRHRAIDMLPKGGTLAEVGTQTGHFANHIFKTAKPRSLHLFDLSLEWFDKSLLVEPIRQGQVQIHLGDSSTELGKFPDEHFDWLYIDGDHSYEGVAKDIAQAIRAVRRDGFLVFNDYTAWSPLEVCNYGVLKAVNELVNGGEWEFVYLALHPWGYHDVALRRRGL
jgi:hypothetical protein